MVNDDTLRWPECKVGEFMAPNAVTIQADASLSLVAETLADYGVSGLPVVDRRGSVVGVVRSRVHGQLHHDHHAVLHRHGAVLGVVPGRRPQALQPGLIRCDRTSLTVRRAISAPIASMPTSMADRWRPATSPWCSSSDVA